MKSQVTSKLTQLINDEAMKQLADNYHELLPKLIKIDIDHIEEDMSYAVGAAYFMIDKRIIFTPIIYRDGAVDSISYIGDTENETLYGLTKRMYKRLISSSKTEFGKALSEKEQERLLIDKGIIGRLFATPQTISPKVASDENYEDNIIIDMLDSPIFAKSFEKLASMPAYREVLNKVYGDRVFEKLASVNTLHKLASIDRDEDGSMTFNSISDLNSLPKNKRGEAAMAIAKEGFYKVASAEPTKSVALRIPTMGELLMKAKSKLEVLTEPGIYNAITKDLRLVPAIVARHGSGNKNYIYYHDSTALVQNGSQEPRSKRGAYNSPENLTGYLGMEAGAFNDDPRSHIISVFGEERKPVNADKLVITASKDDIIVYSINSVTRVGKEIVVDVWSDPSSESIVIGEAYGYTKKENTTYIHPNHVLFLGRKSGLSHVGERNKAHPLSELMTTDDIDSAFVKTASFDVTYSAGRYFYGNERLSKPELINELRETGYDNESISTIVKTAQDAGGMPVDFNEISLTLKAILSEITESKILMTDLRSAMMAAQGIGNGETTEQPQPQGQPAQTPQGNQGQPEQATGQEGQPAGADGQSDPAVQSIMELAASVGADGQAVLQAGQQQGMEPAQIAQQLQQEISQMQGGGEQPQPQQGAGQGSPMEQDMAAQGQQMAGQDPSQMQGQAQSPQVAGQDGSERTTEELQQQGYNPNMTPEMLDQLQQIADKDVLNASIISYLVDTPDAKAVTSQYIDDITRGVNGLARTLLLVEIQRTSFNDQIGDKQLNTFLSRGKTLLNRMTDFVIDVSVID